MDLTTLMALALVLLVTNLGTILAAFGYNTANKWASIAFMAFSYVEKTIPNDYGTGTNDPASVKMLHKIDVFCQKFKEFYIQMNGESPTADELQKARLLASNLAAGTDITSKLDA